MLKPRFYQVGAVQAGLDFFHSKKKGNEILICPTGSGKSVIIALLATELIKTGKVLVLQPTKEILQQNFSKFISYGCRAGIYSASAGMKYRDDVTFATIGSIAKKHHLFTDYKHILIDECFPYNQWISTEKGKMRIGLFVKQFNAGVKMPLVYSYNESTKQMELKPVVAARCNGEKELLKLKFSGNVVCKTTFNHPFLTDNGWKKAGDLKIGDCILSDKSSNTYASIPNEDQVNLINGSILGDGSIDVARKVLNMNRFRFIQGNDQKEYLAWKAEILGGKIRTIEKNGFAQNKAFAFSSKVMYFEDAKCSKMSAIQNLTVKSLAVSWMDDGHIAKAENNGSLYATATSKELTESLIEKLKEFGINGAFKTGISKLSGNSHFYIQFKKEDIRKISELIAPYVHPSMSYKLCSEYRHKAGSYIWDNKFCERGAAVLTSIENSKPEQVYNIQVADNETYVLASGKYIKEHKTVDSGIIVHNCHLVNAEEGMYHALIKTLEHSKVLGLTATPYRLSAGMEGAMLKFITRTLPRIFNRVAYSIQNDILFDAGYLAPLNYYSFSKIDRNKLETNSKGTDFTDASLKAYYRQINMVGITIDYANRLLAKRKNLLVFCSLISEAYQVSKGVPGSVVLTGETPGSERDRILAKFKKGEIRCVVNVGVLTTGFDYPALEAVLIARSTMSLALYYQIIGRIMRPYTYADGTKKVGWVVDLGGNIELFGKIETMRIETTEKGLYYISNIVGGQKKQLTNVPFQKAA